MSTDIIMIFGLSSSAGVFYINLELLKRIKVSHITLIITLPVKWDSYTSSLISKEFKSLMEISEKSNIDLIIVGPGVSRFPPIFSRTFRKISLFYDLLKQVKSCGDIIHFTWPWKNYSLKILKFLEKKVVSNCYDIIPLKLPELYPWPEFKKHIYFWKKSDAVPVLSLNTKKDLVSLGVDDEKIFITYPGVDTQLFHPIPKDSAKRELGLPTDKRILLYVGSLEPKRAIPMKAFLQAYKSLTEKYKDLILILAGPFKYLSMEMTDSIIVLRNVPRRKLPFLYASADTFIFPTLYEGFGIPPLESMACGTPVIVPQNSSLPEVVGDAGIYVENPLDPREWYEKVEIMFKDESLRDYLSRKGITRAQVFSWDKSAEILREVYETLSRR